MALIYRPKHPFAADVDGLATSFTRDTLVEAGHPILDAYPELFEPIEAHFKAPGGVESATAEPGKKRNR